MKYNKIKFRNKINKIRVRKQINSIKSDGFFTSTQLKTINNLFDQWIKEPKPTAPLKANTIGLIDGVSDYKNCLQLLREYSGKTVELGRTHWGQLIMPDMNYAISEMVDLLNSMDDKQITDWHLNNTAVLNGIEGLRQAVDFYERDIFYDETYEGSDYVLKKIVEKFNKLLRAAGISEVPEVQIIHY